MTRYPKHFGLLFLLLVVEGGVASMSVLAVVPMADVMIDPSLGKPSRCISIPPKYRELCRTPSKLLKIP